MNKTEHLNQIIKKGRENGMISTKEISDGHHTFGELYEQRSILFITICNSYSDLSWKSRKHFDEENYPMFNDDFIAGINTPLGMATFHLKRKYWDMLQVPVLERAPQYDHYSSEDVMVRIYSLCDTTFQNQEKKYR